MRLLGGATYKVSIIRVGGYESLLWTEHGVVIHNRAKIGMMVMAPISKTA